MEDPRWKETMANGTKYETKFVEIMNKDITEIEDFATGEGGDQDWRSSLGAMEWLNENYKKKAGKRRKTRKTKTKTRRSKKSTRT